MKHKEWAIPQSFLAIACAVLMLVFSVQVFAQAGIDTGNVTGTVTDQTGAIMQKAQCTLTNVNTGTTQKTISTSAGAYVFTNVSVGTYSLQVAAQGFEDSVVNGIVVHIGATVTEDVSLHVGAASASVTVTSAAPLLQAQETSLGLSIGSNLANELPLSGGAQGRSALSLIILTPGSQPVNSQFINGVQTGALDVRVNGADSNVEVFAGQLMPIMPDAVEEIKVETGDNAADVGHTYGTTVNMLTKVGTNKLHGRLWEYNENDLTSANNYFTKRSQMLTTPTPLPNRPPRLRENSFGAVVSGPVFIPGVYDGHNKTFFTGAFQYTYYSNVSNYTGTVPTASMQSSFGTSTINMSDQLTIDKNTKIDGLHRTIQNGVMLDPATTRAVTCGAVDPITGLTADCLSTEAGVVTDTSVNGGLKSAIVRDPYFATPGAGCPALAGTTSFLSTAATGGTVPMACLNQLPSSRVDTNAIALLKLFPAADIGISNPAPYTNNYFTTMRRTVVSKGYSARIDHTFNEKDSAFLTYNHYNAIDQTTPPYAGALEGGSSVSFWTTQPAYIVVLSENHVFSQTLINAFRISKGQQYNTRLDPNSINTTYGVPSQYGIAGIPQTSFNGGLPVFSVTPFSSFGSRVNDTWQKTGSWQVSDELTKIIGKHEWKFGGEYTWIFGNIDQNSNSRGSFTYNGVYSDVPFSGVTATALADFLVTPATYAANQNGASYATATPLSVTNNLIGGLNSYAGNSRVKSTYHAPYIAAYAVDNWKMTPELTANLGVRWEYFGPFGSDGGQEANFWMGGDGNQPSGSAYYVGHEGCASSMSPFFKGLLAYDNIPIICEPGNTVNHAQKANFSPRLGLAYRVRPNLVVRAGTGFAYGAFNSIGYGGTLGTNYPFRFNIQNGSANNAYRPQLIGSTSTTTATMESTFGNLDMTNAAAAYLPLGSLALYGKPYHFKTPYQITLDAAVQYQFTNHDSIEVRFVSNLGRQLESGNPYHNAARELLAPNQTLVKYNTIAGDPYSASSIDSTIPFPNLSVNAGPVENTGMISANHSGQAEYVHQFALGINMDANYTYTNCLSDAQGGQENDTPGNGRAPWVKGFGGYRADYVRCSNTSANVFKVFGEFNLPFGKGALVAGNVNRLVDGAIGGWKLDPIFYAASGNYLNVGCAGTIGGDPTTAGFTGPWFEGGTAWGCNAPLVKGVNPYGPGPHDAARTRTTGYFNSTAFTAPAQAVQTNGQLDFSPLGRRANQILGPGWYNFDMSTHKQLLIHEKMNVEIVAEAFNVFNHAEMSNPTVTGYTKPSESTLSGWGTITGIRNGPRTWEFAAKFNF